MGWMHVGMPAIGDSVEVKTIVRSCFPRLGNVPPKLILGRDCQEYVCSLPRTTRVKNIQPRTEIEVEGICENVVQGIVYLKGCKILRNGHKLC